MNEPGHIYILINPSMEGLVKIGKTTRVPDDRAKELSQATGVPTPFYVAFSIEVTDCHSAEDYVYSILEHNGFNRSPNREFFEIPLRSAIKVLMLAERELGRNHGGVQESGRDDEDEKLTLVENDEGQEPDDLAEEPGEPQHPGSFFMKKAANAFYGFDDEIKDEDEAIRLLYKAKALNHPGAFTALAHYYRDRPLFNGMWPDDKEGRRGFYEKAFQILKEGAQRGHARCYVEMAEMYNLGESNQHLRPDKDNAIKCWKKYFRSSSFVNDEDARCNYEGMDGSMGFPRAFHSDSYLCSCFRGSLSIDPDIRNILVPIRKEILEIIRRRIMDQETDLANKPSHTSTQPRLPGLPSDEERLQQERCFLLYADSVLR